MTTCQCVTLTLVTFFGSVVGALIGIALAEVGIRIVRAFKARNK